MDKYDLSKYIKTFFIYFVYFYRKIVLNHKNILHNHAKLI
nr:MAG TPA: hypothetical protein [Caudoviricetes sp.]